MSCDRLVATRCNKREDRSAAAGHPHDGFGQRDKAPPDLSRLGCGATGAASPNMAKDSRRKRWWSGWARSRTGGRLGRTVSAGGRPPVHGSKAGAKVGPPPACSTPGVCWCTSDPTPGMPFPSPPARGTLGFHGKEGRRLTSSDSLTAPEAFPWGWKNRGKPVWKRRWVGTTCPRAWRRLRDRGRPHALGPREHGGWRWPMRWRLSESPAAPPTVPKGVKGVDWPPPRVWKWP